MLAAFALTMLAYVQADDALTITTKYLEALSRLDDTAMAELSDWTPAERDRARAFRAFERATHTRWTWRIVGREGNSVYAFETEDNEYYDLLGVGTSTQIAAYRVEGGRIRAAETRFHINASGNQAEVATRFKEWLVGQPGGNDPAVVQGGRLVFDETSARHMLPWLERWKANGRP